MRRILLSSVLTSLIAAAPASAQTVTAADPETVMAALRGLGYDATRDTDSRGDPLVRSTIEGIKYRVEFYGCESNANCRSLLFSVFFDLDTPTNAEHMNDWNRNRLVGVAVVDDEGDPGIQQYVNTEGGLSEQNFRANVTAWGRAVAAFKTHINW